MTMLATAPGTLLDSSLWRIYEEVVFSHGSTRGIDLAVFPPSANSAFNKRSKALTVITRAGRAIVRPTIKARFAAWKAECRTCIGTTAFLRILLTATLSPGAAEHGVLEPGAATVHLIAIGTETVIGMETGIGTATGIVTEMTVVMDIMTTGGIAGGTSTITTATRTMTKATMTTTAKSKDRKSVV